MWLWTCQVQCPADICIHPAEIACTCQWSHWRLDITCRSHRGMTDIVAVYYNHLAHFVQTYWIGLGLYGRNSTINVFFQLRSPIPLILNTSEVELHLGASLTSECLYRSQKWKSMSGEVWNPDSTIFCFNAHPFSCVSNFRAERTNYCWTCSLALRSSTSRFVHTACIYLFRSFSLCFFIQIHYLHPSCLVSVLLSTGYGPRHNAIDNFSCQPPLLLQPPSSQNQLELYLILSPSDFEAFIPYLHPMSTLAHQFPSVLSNFSSQ